jgi:hypothetical protein
VIEDLIGTTVPVFIGLTLVLFGGAAFMTGQGLASGWRPIGRTVLFAALLGAGNRFLVYALFGGPLLSLVGYVVATLVLLAICVVAYRLTRVHMMVSQYPWLYERHGPFGWRDRASERG